MKTLKTIRHGVPFLLCILYAGHAAARVEPTDTIASAQTGAEGKEEAEGKEQGPEGAQGKPDYLPDRYHMVTVGLVSPLLRDYVVADEHADAHHESRDIP